jgi:5-methyltetrahydrofolate--homocysteine methyltransferase
MQKSRAFLDLEAAAAERILVMDGSVGVMLQERGLGEEAFRAGPLAGHPAPLKGDSDALCLSSPGIVMDVHRAYLDAGADIIKTNSFTATRLGQGHYGLGPRAAEIALAAARLARAAVDERAARCGGRRRFVAGSIGPTGVSLSMSRAASAAGRPPVSFEELSAAYREEAEALIDGGADILLVETVFDALNGKAALYAILSIFEERGTLMPIIVSGTIVDRAGRSLSGQTQPAFMASVAHCRPFALGLNCSFGADALLPELEEVAAVSPFRLSVHPNAGLPNAEGGYDETPDSFAGAIARFARSSGLNVAGGCCGTRPSHIAALAAALDGIAPRPAPGRRRATFLSGLELLEIGPGSLFVNVGERANVSGSRKFAALARDGKWDEALDVARGQVEAGAQAIDICMDDPLVDSAAAMAEFVSRASAEPDIARVPFMIDSSDFGTIVAGLRRAQGKCVVNSISLKEGEGPFLERAREIARHGAAVVVMAFDEEGQAATLERRVSTLERAFRLLELEAGYDPSDVILDPNVFAVGTGIAEHRSYAADFLEATRMLKAALPGALVSGGVSNVSFAFRGNDALREAIHTVFLYYAKAAGMDMGIVNPAALGVYDQIEPALRELVEDLILDRRPDATERLLEALASAPASGGAAAGLEAGASGRATGAAEPAWRALAVGERLVSALVAGVSNWVAADALEARGTMGSAIAVISGPLMAGMDKVGALFAEGRMFLPQVVKSARVMKAAVDVLLPFLEAEGGGAASRGRIVLATVKGDVHDIGKNIAAVVLRCNGYEVVDLGVMVDCADILDAAERGDASAIGLSGLIAPSLEEMARVARAMEGRGMRIPLLVGGATTSPAHTALNLATAYSGPVVNVRDASRAAGVLARLLDPARRPAYEAELAAAHEALRASRLERTASSAFLPLAEARSRAPAWDYSAYSTPPPRERGVVELRPGLRELVPFVDWKFFFYEWGMKEGYPGFLEDPERGPEARKLKSDADAALARMSERAFAAAALCAFLPAASSGDDIVVFADESRREERFRIPFLRQQAAKGDGSPNLCLADYLAPDPRASRSSPPDWLGVFAVTAGKDIGAEAERLSASGDEYGSLMRKILADRVAEAAAEWLHAEVRWRLWGYAPDEALSPSECLAVRYRGIRPAPGYPACPDHRDKAPILDALGARGRLGMNLTESFMMTPESSVSGFYFSRPDARYFAVGGIGRDQLEDYASRRGEPAATSENFLRECMR